MVDGIKAGAEALKLMTLRLDTLAANMANASTAAYKKDELEASMSVSQEGGSVKSRTYIDLSQGELVKTGNKLDLALEGQGFFQVGAADSPRYTRDGRFAVDASGRLVTSGGQPVHGRGGPVLVDPALEVSVGPDGAISQAGRDVDKLKVVRFEDPGTLAKAGEGLFTASGTGEPAAAAVRQGFVESSNVRLVEEMAAMMRLMRNFDSVQRAMTAQDGATGKLISTMGRF